MEFRTKKGVSTNLLYLCAIANPNLHLVSYWYIVCLQGIKATHFSHSKSPFYVVLYVWNSVFLLLISLCINLVRTVQEHRRKSFPPLLQHGLRILYLFIIPFFLRETCFPIHLSAKLTPLRLSLPSISNGKIQLTPCPLCSCTPHQFLCCQSHIAVACLHVCLCNYPMSSWRVHTMFYPFNSLIQERFPNYVTDTGNITQKILDNKHWKMHDCFSGISVIFYIEMWLF